jgi:hypothetical protein
MLNPLRTDMRKSDAPGVLGWYPDPHDRQRERYWNGTEWTSHARRRYLLGLFKREFWTDWTLWLAAFAIVAGVTSVQNDYDAADDAGSVANFIELVIVVVFQFVLFGVVPAAIRLAVRSRRYDETVIAADAEASTVDEEEVSTVDESDRAGDEVRDDARGVSRRHRTVRLGAIVVVALLLVGMGDWLARNLETSALAGAIQASEETITRGNLELERIDEEAVGEDEYKEAAAEIAAEVRVAQQRVKDVRFLPWHSTRAKSRYIDHSQAWATVFTEVSYDNPNERALDRAWVDVLATWDIAVEALEDTVPPLPLFKLNGRVDRIVSG